MTYDYHGCYWGFRLLHNDHYLLNFHSLGSDQNRLYRNNLYRSCHRHELHNSTTNHRKPSLRLHQYNTNVYLPRNCHLPIHSNSNLSSRHNGHHGGLHRGRRSLRQPLRLVCLICCLQPLLRSCHHLHKQSCFPQARKRAPFPRTYHRNHTHTLDKACIFYHYLQLKYRSHFHIHSKHCELYHPILIQLYHL